MADRLIAGITKDVLASNETEPLFRAHGIFASSSDVAVATIRLMSYR